ncbi:5991_t:CDS:2 [Gigaspora margarita]|uniref:5991_t:CDS:1 n=1 Tax=Gigaspora margarita TaxID=4874 RepID=A0ABN7UQJ9_GIGMA|nr:5991_t:CDS:2 [Gigaspora margarita]
MDITNQSITMSPITELASTNMDITDLLTKNPFSLTLAELLTSLNHWADPLADYQIYSELTQNNLTFSNAIETKLNAMIEIEHTTNKRTTTEWLIATLKVMAGQ